jgi:hypothetical protein
VSGKSFCSMNLHLGEGARISCSTYPDGGHPILSFDVPSLYLMLAPSGHKTPITEHDVHNARALAKAASVYLAEVERLHAESAEIPEASSDAVTASAKPGAAEAA